jgi:hypothetical protein
LFGVSVYSRWSSASTVSPSSARRTTRLPALTFFSVEDVQRAAAIEGDVVGDVDQRVDGAQADRDQALLQPFRRRAVLHAAHEAQREAGAKVRRLDRHPRRASPLPATGSTVVFRVPRPEAARSRAMP